MYPKGNSVRLNTVFRREPTLRTLYCLTGKRYHYQSQISMMFEESGVFSPVVFSPSKTQKRQYFFWLTLILDGHFILTETVVT